MRHKNLTTLFVKDNGEVSEEEEENSVIEDPELVPPSTNYTCDQMEVFGTVSTYAFCRAATLKVIKFVYG